MVTSLVSNPPYNIKWKIPTLAGFMPEYAGYTLPPENNANYAFVLSGISKIDSRAAFLLPCNVLATSSPTEQRIKYELIQSNLLSAIIILPDSMFESTNIPVCVMLLDKQKTSTKITFIDLRNSAEQEVRDQRGQFGSAGHTKRTYHKTVNVLSDDIIQKARVAINNREDIEGIATSVLPETVLSHDCNLTPGLYVTQSKAEEHYRPFEDIAADYNRIIKQKNEIKVRMNKTAAARLGYGCLDHDKPDISESFAVVGQKAEQECFVRFSAEDGIEIKCSTKNGIPDMIVMFLNHWKQRIMYLNNEENRILAEFRDTLLPKLMNGEIDISDMTKT